jgi:hypothetical protein
VVGGVYNTLYFGGFGRTTVGFLWQISNDIASDDADKGSSPGDFNVTASATLIILFIHQTIPFFNNIWLGHYSAITTANKAIDILEKSSLEVVRKNRLAGGSRFCAGCIISILCGTLAAYPK